MKTEVSILKNLLQNDEFKERVFSFLNSDYFEDKPDKIVFKEIKKFAREYDSLPSQDALEIEILKRKDLSEGDVDDINSILQDIYSPLEKKDSIKWLIDNTEEFCQKMAIKNAVVDSMQIIEGNDKHRDTHSIPDLLKKALGVSFDLKVGKDFDDDWESQFDYYTDPKTHIPSSYYFFDKTMKGGVVSKTLNMGMADTNVGKSLMLCALAANYRKQGLNVLYISMEMDEEQVMKRIDANMLGVSIDDLENMSKDDKEKYKKKKEKVRNKYDGKLKIIEYGSGTAHAGHFRQLLDEYVLKNDFKVDVLLIDYLNICASSGWKKNSVRHDLYIKYIAEELRNIAKDYEIPVWTVTQSNREGSDGTELTKKQISESYGVIQTCDFFVGMWTNDELEAKDQMRFKILKNRYGGDKIQFIMNVDKNRQRLFDVEGFQTDVEEKVKEVAKEHENKKESDAPFQNKKKKPKNYGAFDYA